MRFFLWGGGYVGVWWMDIMDPWIFVITIQTQSKRQVGRKEPPCRHRKDHCEQVQFDSLPCRYAFQPARRQWTACWRREVNFAAWAIHSPGHSDHKLSIHGPQDETFQVLGCFRMFCDGQRDTELPLWAPSCCRDQRQLSRPSAIWRVSRRLPGSLVVLVTSMLCHPYTTCWVCSSECLGTSDHIWPPFRSLARQRLATSCWLRLARSKLFLLQPSLWDCSRSQKVSP